MFPSLRFHPSYLALNEHIDGASTTSRGRRFQFSTILCEKKPALSDVLHRGLYNFKLCPRVPHSPSDLTKYCLQSTSSLPVKILYTSSMSPRIRRCSSVCNPMTLSLSSYPVFYARDKPRSSSLDLFQDLDVFAQIRTPHLDVL